MTTTTDAYSWDGDTDTDWGTAANWTDTTTGAPATAPPGATNAVTVDGFEVDITGTGAAASLALDGLITLGGQFTTGGLTVGYYDMLTLGSGATLTDSGDATLEDGASLTLSGANTALSVAGTLAIGTQGEGGSCTIGLYGGAMVSSAAISALETLSLYLDASSSFEVGSGHHAVAGSFTVDHGSTLALSGTLSAPTATVNGVLDAQTLTLSAGTLAGNGTIDILGSLALGSYGATAGGSGLTLDFAAAGGALQLDSASLDSAGMLEPAVAGFAAGDQIDWAGTLIGATYAHGTLTLQGGGQTVASLHFKGGIAGGQYFALAPTSFSTTEVVLIGAGDTKVAPKGTGAAANYVWNGGIGGSWDAAGNWTDTTAGTGPAAVAPGTKDTVTIGALYAGYQSETTVISGKGNAGTLDVNGATEFVGVFTAAALNETGGAGGLYIEAGDSLTIAGTAQINAFGATTTVSGAGAVLSVGTLVLDTSQTPYGDQLISLTDGGLLKAGGVQDFSGGTIAIDATAAFLIGATGTAAAGSMTIASGATAALAAEIAAPSLVVDGTLIAGQAAGYFGLDLSLDVGAITGTGTIEIQTALSFAAAADWANGPLIDFEPGGVLDLAPQALDGSGHFGGTIGQFSAGDSIVWDGTTLTNVAFAGGTLSLVAAAGTVATIAVDGIAANETFLLLPSFYNGSTIVVTGAGDTKAAPAGTGTADSYAWRGATNASWDQAGNWNDISAGTGPAAVAPGANDAVTLGTTSFAVGTPSIVSGKGDAALLTIEGSYLFAGSVTAASLAFGNGNSSLYLDAADRLTVTGGAISNDEGTIVVAGAKAALNVAGTFTLAQPQQNYGGAVFAATGGGAIEFGGLASATSLVLSVDQTSSIEIGAAGDAAAGAMTIDAGATAALDGIIEAGTLALNGTLIGNGATIDVGTLAGTGTAEVGTALTIYGADDVSLAGGNGVSVSFTGANETLTLGAVLFSQGGTFAPTIANFGAGDIIAIGTTITGTSFNAGSLTLLDGAATVATLKLAGTYTGLRFVVLPYSYYTGSQILVVGYGDTGTAPAGTKTANTYVYNTPYGGSWDVAGNWTDSTTGAMPATVAPGTKDSVTLGGLGYDANQQVITGTGSAATLTIDNPVLLDGNFTAATVMVGNAQGLSASVTLYNGASLQVTGNATLDSTLALDAGSSFTTAGTLAVGGPAYAGVYLSLTGGAAVSAATLAVEYANITLDATSALSVGGHGQAGAGTFLVAADATATITGEIIAPTLTVGGTLDTTNTTLMVNTLSGTGTLAFAGTLAIATDTAGSLSSGAKLTLAFDQGATLDLGAQDLGGNGAFSPTLANFGTDDTIVWAGDLSSASYANGKLTLFSGSAAVGTLTLAGNYSNDSFVVQPEQYAYASLITLQANPVDEPGTHGLTGFLLDQQPPLHGRFDVAQDWIHPVHVA